MRLGSITRALLVPFVLLAINGDKKANAIVLPNVNALSPANGKTKDPPVAEKAIKEHEKLKKEIAELETLMLEMVANPEKFKDKSLVEIQQKLTTLRIMERTIEEIHRQQKEFHKQEAIDQLKWGDQDGFKQHWGGEHRWGPFNPPLGKNNLDKELDKLKKDADNSVNEAKKYAEDAAKALDKVDYHDKEAKRLEEKTNFTYKISAYTGSAALILFLAILLVLKKQKADREYLSSPNFNRKTLRMLNQFIPDSKIAPPNRLLVNLAVSGNIPQQERDFIREALVSTNLPSCFSTQIGLNLCFDKNSFVYVQKTDDIKATLKELGINDLENVDLEMDNYTAKIKAGKKNIFLILYKENITDYPKAFSIFIKEYIRIGHLQSDEHKALPLEKVEKHCIVNSLKTIKDILESQGTYIALKQGFAIEFNKLAKVLEKVDRQVLEQYLKRLKPELERELGPELMDELFKYSPAKMFRLLIKEPDPEYGFFVPGKPLEKYTRSLN